MFALFGVTIFSGRSDFFKSTIFACHARFCVTRPRAAAFASLLGLGGAGASRRHIHTAERRAAAPGERCAVQEFFHVGFGGLMPKFQYQFQMEFGEDTEKTMEHQKHPRLRDLKTICLWISYAETRVFGCAAASGQSEPCAKQQNMQIRVVPKHFITSLQLLDLIAKVSPCLHSARSRQMSGWKSPGQPVLRMGKEFLLFHKWCCIGIDFNTFLLQFTYFYCVSHEAKESWWLFLYAGSVCAKTRLLQTIWTRCPPAIRRCRCLMHNHHGMHLAI